MGALATIVCLALALAAAASGSVTGKAAHSSSKDPAGTVGTTNHFANIKSMCGKKPATVGLIYGVNNAWGTVLGGEIKNEAAKCKNIKSVQVVDANGSETTQNTAITTMAAKGVNIIVVIANAGAGPAAVQAMAQATKAGSVVVAAAVDPEATEGKQYFDFVNWRQYFLGVSWGKWMVSTLGKKGGNIVFLGGVAGNTVSMAELSGVKSVLKTNHQIKLLTPTPVTTNWEPSVAQQAMSGLLAKYKDINGVITDYGATAEGAIRAYQASGTKLVPIATTDENDLSCGFAALHKSNPLYQLATVSSRTWIVRVGLRKGLAEYEGTADPEPSIFNLGLFEDSTGKTPGSKHPQKACLAGAPADATPSALLTPAQQKKLLG